LTGDYSKAKKVLGWAPQVKFNELVEMIVEADLKKIKNLSDRNIELEQSHYCPL
jgi:GDP-D-mannose dehydratase